MKKTKAKSIQPITGWFLIARVPSPPKAGGE